MSNLCSEENLNDIFNGRVSVSEVFEKQLNLFTEPYKGGIEFIGGLFAPVIDSFILVGVCLGSAATAPGVAAVCIVSLLVAAGAALFKNEAFRDGTRDFSNDALKLLAVALLTSVGAFLLAIISIPFGVASFFSRTGYTIRALVRREPLDRELNKSDQGYNSSYKMFQRNNRENGGKPTQETSYKDDDLSHAMYQGDNWNNWGKAKHKRIQEDSAKAAAKELQELIRHETKIVNSSIMPFFESLKNNDVFKFKYELKVEPAGSNQAVYMNFGMVVTINFQITKGEHELYAMLQTACERLPGDSFYLNPLANGKITLSLGSKVIVNLSEANYARIVLS